MRKWLWAGIAIIAGLALYLAGNLEGLLLALLGAGGAGAGAYRRAREETDKSLDGIKETSKRFDDLKAEHRREVERIVEENAAAPVADLLRAANERERRRRNKTE